MAQVVACPRAAAQVLCCAALIFFTLCEELPSSAPQWVINPRGAHEEAPQRCGTAIMSNPMDRSGRAPNAFGLTGAAGLQLKKPAKKFGLQKPKQAARPTSGSVFGDAAVEDTLDVSEELERMRQSKSARAAAAAEHQAAISQDASVFDYDGAYDAMQEQRKEARELTTGKSGQQKSAKYIGTIMEAHKERQIENDKIFERKLVKEAEAEAHLYGDKEKFVTAAYRKKMQAREEFEAEQKAKEAKEEKEDVTKRKDMSHFYSNLLHGNVGEVPAASASRDAAYAASSGGKAAGAVAPPKDDSAAAAAAAAASTSAAEAGGSEAGGSEAGGAGSRGAAAPAEEPGEGAAGAAGEGGKASPDEELARAIVAANAQRASRPLKEVVPEPVSGVVYERRNGGDEVLSAKERYLQRKKQKLGE